MLGRGHRARQPPAESLAELQLQLDSFRAYHNAERPHRALRGATPGQVFERRIKARPALDRAPTWFRVRQDRVSKAGDVTVLPEPAAPHRDRQGPCREGGSPTPRR